LRRPTAGKSILEASFWTRNQVCRTTYFS
jgi:hypothetical protein